MIKSEYKIGKVWGIPIKIHISMLLFLAYLALTEAFGDNNGGFIKSLMTIISVLIGGVLIFTSIALHELGHSYVAIRKGCRVYEITLMFMGGAAKMDKMPSHPRDEFLMAMAGPAVSLLLGIIGLGIGIPLFISKIAPYLSIIFVSVGAINMVLAVFNLVPAFPMDGGRVFRALLTPRYGRTKATFIASRLGRAIAIAFFIIGIVGLKNFAPFGIQMFSPGNPVLIIIAIFIFINADREYRMVQYEELMKQRSTGNNNNNNIWSSIFGNMHPPTQPPPPPPPREEPMDDSVHISPPPYAKGPDAHTDLHHTNATKNNPFKNFFNR